MNAEDIFTQSLSFDPSELKLEQEVTASEKTEKVDAGILRRDLEEVHRLLDETQRTPHVAPESEEGMTVRCLADKYGVRVKTDIHEQALDGVVVKIKAYSSLVAIKRAIHERMKDEPS